MDENTLYYKVQNNISLTEEEKHSIYEVFSFGAHKENRERLLNCIHWGIRPNYGIYERVVFENGRCRYYAGQSYPDEIKMVRNLIIGKA
jgi:hypothetical protein